MTAWREMTPEEMQRRRRALASASPVTMATVHPLPPGALAPASGLPEVALIRGDSVTPRAIRWLWRGYLAAGKFHVLGGQPGTGKTTIALDFAATVSSGGPWPDGTRAEDGNVVIWSGEDDAEDVLAPRLQAMGAEMTRIFFVGDVRRGIDAAAFDPANDLPALERKLESIGGARLLIVDPIVSVVAGDSHKNAETRRSLQVIVNLAQRLDCAALGITHFSKGTGGREPIERITGSLAFGALARVVLVAFKLPEDGPDGGPARILARAKSNISPDDGGFGYELIHEDLDGFPGVGASRVAWGAPIDGTARELLAKAEDVDEDGSGGNARDFLRCLLEPGPMRAADVFRDAKAHGYSERQMQRARSAIGARVDKLGMREGWEWSLPKMPLGHEDTEYAEQTRPEPSAPSAESDAYRARRGD
jgi:putative DNA primase/helicase